jgi:hypothetical protein
MSLLPHPETIEAALKKIVTSQRIVPEFVSVDANIMSIRPDISY